MTKKTTKDKIKTTKPKTKKVKVEIPTTASKLNRLAEFFHLYTKSSRKFSVGDFIVVSDYSIFRGREDRKYKLATVIKAPSMFSRRTEFTIAYVSEDGFVDITTLDPSDIICLLADAPVDFKYV